MRHFIEPTMFVKTKRYLENEIQFLFGNYNMRPLDIYNGPSQSIEDLT